MRTLAPRMDPRTGEWENVTCPECDVTPTRNGRTCDDCLAATYDDLMKDTDPT
ncbi:hypothetical protein [Gordonia sp. (in: high G+C Gram-positive bacteria)]|uniref:hypothetical protein n=1 Tax=Gordonia sp. (in: high G+C Gram-positive bacteria) TaxID=84139 RepID=UPI00333EE9C4